VGRRGWSERARWRPGGLDGGREGGREGGEEEGKGEREGGRDIGEEGFNTDLRGTEEGETPKYDLSLQE